jgi:hypothetical protein
MASFETRVTEIRADPRGGFSVMLKPHFLERDVAFQKVWLEPHFENHCASIAEDSIEVRTDELPSVLIRRSFEQLGSPAGFRRLLALAFGEILSSPGIYRSGGSLVKKSGE